MLPSYTDMKQLTTVMFAYLSLAVATRDPVKAKNIDADALPEWFTEAEYAEMPINYNGPAEVHSMEVMDQNEAKTDGVMAVADTYVAGTRLYCFRACMLCAAFGEHAQFCVFIQGSQKGGNQGRHRDQSLAANVRDLRYTTGSSCLGAVLQC